eukprot:COSAG02_NODE_2458_length_8805_cov_33.067884_4_plen_140_part_00
MSDQYNAFKHCLNPSCTCTRSSERSSHPHTSLDANSSHPHSPLFAFAYIIHTSISLAVPNSQDVTRWQIAAGNQTCHRSCQIVRAGASTLLKRPDATVRASASLSHALLFAIHSPTVSGQGNDGLNVTYNDCHRRGVSI